MHSSVKIRWIVKVHTNCSQSVGYLTDIHQRTARYYEALEAIQTSYPVRIDQRSFSGSISPVSHSQVGSEHRCFVHSENKFNARWEYSNCQLIASIIFGIAIIVGFMVIMFYWIKEFCTKEIIDRVVREYGDKK